MTRFDALLRTVPLYLLAVTVPVSVSLGGIATALTLVAAAAVAVRDRRAAAWPPRAVAGALGLLFGAYLLAVLTAGPGARHWHKLFEESWIKLLLLAVPLLGASRPRDVARALRLTLLVGAVAAAYAVWQHFSAYDLVRHRSLLTLQWGHVSATAFFSHHLSYGGQVLTLTLLTAAWFAGGVWRRARWWALPLCALFGLALFWTYARSALLGTGAGLLALTLLLRGRQRLYSASLLSGLLAVGLLLPPVRVHLLRLLDLEQQATRLNLWHSSWNGILARPWSGFGPGNFPTLLAEHQVEGFYNNLSHAHNDLLMHGVNAGVPGLAAALLLLAVTVTVLWRRWRERPPHGWVLLGALAVQAGITVAGFFQVYQTDDEPEMLLYFVLGCGLALVAGRGRTADDDPTFTA